MQESLYHGSCYLGELLVVLWTKNFSGAVPNNIVIGPVERHAGQKTLQHPCDRDRNQLDFIHFERLMVETVNSVLVAPVIAHASQKLFQLGQSVFQIEKENLHPLIPIMEIIQTVAPS